MDARLRAPLLIGWALASVILCLAFAGHLERLWFNDPDDAMRLLQARDLLAGQSWWDVGQHRLNGGDFPMHWSRLVDLPLVAVMAVFDPLIGEPASTRVAMTVVPLLTLLVVMAAAAALTRRVAGLECAKLAVLLVPLSAPIVHQIRPMRIDHHGWQIALALIAVALIVGPATRRRGALAGAALGGLLTVSLEGLPITAAIGGAAALVWVVRRERGPFILAMTWALFASAAALHVATRGPGMWAEACDAVSPAWLASLATAALGVSAAVRLPDRGPVVRLASLSAAGAAALGALAYAAPDCLRGPFASLDPLVREIWYLNVAEGLPIWTQIPVLGGTIVALPIVGLIGAAFAWREAEGEARARWTVLIGVAAAAFVISLLVARAAATANVLAVPGAAFLLQGLLTRARAVPTPGKRTVATAAALLAASPGLAVGIGGRVTGLSEAQGVVAIDALRPPCVRPADIRGLAALPPATVFAPLDVSPELVATTRHRSIAGGYHRNAEAMRRVIAAFLGTPEEARRIVLASGADYVAGCPYLNEAVVYTARAPNGFWARLERGERFDWLEPVALPGTPALAWRVRRDPLRPVNAPR